MSKTSSISMLPKKHLAKLMEWIADPATTQAVALELLNNDLAKAGLEIVISKSALGRWAKDFSQELKEQQERAEVAAVWVRQIGRMPQGEIGQTMIQMVQAVAFDISKFLLRDGVTRENTPALIKMLDDLSRMILNLEKSISLNVKREKEIRAEEREQAASAAASAAKAAGVSQETVEAIRRDVLRMAA